MSTSRIRQLVQQMHDRDAFVYTIGQPRRFPINGKQEERIISEIIEKDNCYEIYLSNGPICQLWNRIAKSDRVDVNFFID